jgi:hypothetical protein
MYFCFKYMHIRICIERFLHVAICLRAGAQSLHIRRAVAVASWSRGQRRRRRKINKFIWIRPGPLDWAAAAAGNLNSSDSAARHGAFGCQWSTSRRQRNNIDEQKNDFSRSIRRPLLRKRSWISRSTCTPKSKHRKSTQTSTMLLK